jgi:uncharacterized phage protein (TIGR02220 family)
MNRERTTEVIEVLEFVNQTTGSNFTLKDEAGVELILKKLNEGYSAETLFKIIARKWSDWKGTKFQQYVRPTTLFGKNFETYLHESNTPKPNRIRELFNSVERAKQARWRLVYD